MSVKLMGAVWELDLPQNLKFILLAMADHANDRGGRCYPSVRYLAWKSGYSERQVQAILAELRQRGLITAVAHERGGYGHSTEYLIEVEKGAKLAPFVPKIEGRGGPRQRVRADAERVQPAAPKGAVATAPQSSGTVIGEPSGNHHPARCKSGTSPADDSVHLNLFDDLRKTFPWLTLQKYLFGITRVKARAKTPPQNVAYWRKSLPAFFRNFEGEVEVALTDAAEESLRTGVELADVRESVKCTAAQYDLAYDADLVARVIECAMRRIEDERSAQAEANVGALRRKHAASASAKNPAAAEAVSRCGAVAG